MSWLKRNWPWVVGGVALLGLVGGVAVFKLRGLRNNNPGNLREFRVDGWKRWKGAIGVDSEFHLIFISALYGIRAMFENLFLYNKNHGINTLTGIFERWAPSNDPNAHNDPANYAQRVATDLGITVDTPLNFDDLGQMIALAQAITKHENANTDPYTEETYIDAFRLA